MKPKGGKKPSATRRKAPARVPAAAPGRAAPAAAAMDERAVRDLFEIARRLTSERDLDTLLAGIGHVAERLTGAEASAILLLDEDGQSLSFKTASGEKGQAVKRVVVPIGQGIAGWVAREWKPLVVDDVAKDPRFLSASDAASGFTTRRVAAAPMLMGDRLIGVCEVINKPGRFSPADAELLQDLSNFAAVALANAQMAERQHNFFVNTLSILTRAIEAHHPAYVGHPDRVAELACRLGRALGLSGEAYKDLHHAALLHDIGMIAMNHQDLAEQATLPAREKSVERMHTLLGWGLIKDVKMLRGVLPIVRHHHEFWDGTGHPDGLAGEAIPLGARILCLIEHLEEIRFSGLKDPDLSDMQVQMAKNGAGTKFDPRVVDAYLALSRSAA